MSTGSTGPGLCREASPQDSGWQASDLRQKPGNLGVGWARLRPEVVELKRVGTWWCWSMWRNSSVQKKIVFFPTNLGLNFGCSFHFFSSHCLNGVIWEVPELLGFSLSRILLRSIWFQFFKVRGSRRMFPLVAMIQWLFGGSTNSQTVHSKRTQSYHPKEVTIFIWYIYIQYMIYTVYICIRTYIYTYIYMLSDPNLLVVYLNFVPFWSILAGVFTLHHPCVWLWSTGLRHLNRWGVLDRFQVAHPSTGTTEPWYNAPRIGEGTVVFFWMERKGQWERIG